MPRHEASHAIRAIVNTHTGRCFVPQQDINVIYISLCVNDSTIYKKKKTIPPKASGGIVYNSIILCTA
jgi:hypothetical protein